MAKRFVYFYFTKRKIEELAAVAPMHVEYWKQAALPGYMGGPFSDRTGGMISFEAEDLDKVEEIVDKDPFNIEQLVEYKWMKEWVLE